MARLAIRARAAASVAGVALLLAPMLVLAAGCDGVSVDRSPGATPAQRAGAAARAIGLTLPAGARVVHAERMHGMDDAARLILIMPAADWRRMEQAIERTVPDAPPASADQLAHLGSDSGDWAPSRQPGLVARQIPWRGGVEALNIGVAPAGPGQVRVFVFWFQT